MCGIAGFTRPHADADGVLGAMLATIRHRGPDQEGRFADNRIAFGMRRLIVIAPDGGTQPRVDAESGDVLVYNGEIYDYRSHARALADEGVPLRDGCDTEVLFAMLRRHGIEGALNRLDGMFAFAFRDGGGDIYLARDRFGEKPLYYGMADGALVFASEPRALRCHPLFRDAGLDRVAVHQYLSFDYIPDERSAFAGIHKLPAGCFLRFDGTRADVRRYWRPVLRGEAGRPRPPLTMDQAVDRADTLLTAAIRARLVADVPLGVFLSGGVDSGLITAIAAREKSDITAYTMGMRTGDGSDALGGLHDESPYAAAVAKALGVNHKLDVLGPDEIPKALDAIEEKLDEPFADPSLPATYLLCRFARRHVTVALSGDGGDELFAGYPNFMVGRFSGLFQRCPGFLARAAQAATRLLPASDRYMSPDFVAQRLAIGLGVERDLQSFHWMASLTPDEKHDLYSPAMRDAVAGADTFAPVRKRLEEVRLTDPRERMLYQFTTLYLPDDILMKTDRASMYNSLEVRAPFLDREFAEFAFSLPPALKVRGFTTKALLRRLAARYLPRQIAERKKHGFAIPTASFMRGPLRDRVRDTLLDSGNPVADWFRRDGLETMVSDHVDGRRDHRKRLWTLYCLFRFAARAF